MKRSQLLRELNDSGGKVDKPPTDNYRSMLEAFSASAVDRCIGYEEGYRVGYRDAVTIFTVAMIVVFLVWLIVN